MWNILSGPSSKPDPKSSGILALLPVLGKSLAISVPLIALLAWTGWRGYAVEKDLVREQLFTEADYALAVQARSMESQIMAVVRDAVFLSGTTSMRNMLDRGAPEDRENLAGQFLNAVARKGYDQVRYIDTQGMERIRAQLRLASPIVIPDEELQDKSHRYYISAGLALERNEVYLTPLDLNMERGQIESPLKPTYRVITPVFDRSKRKQGVLVINVKAREMLEGLSAGVNPDASRIILLDDGGYWLKSPDPAEEWGFMYPERQELTFARRYPEAWNALRGVETGRVETDAGLYASRLVHIATSGTEAGSGVWVFLGQLPGRNAPAEMRLVALVPRQHFERRLADLTAGILANFIGTSSLVFLFAVVLSLILERRKADKRQLQSLNARLEGVLDSATEMSIIATDPQGIITTFNRGAERLLGYTADEMVGRQTPAVFHLTTEVILRGRELSAELGRPVEGFEVFVAKARDQGHETREWTYVRKDREPRIVNLTVTAIRDLRGAVAGYLGVAQDITFEREAKARLQFQNLLMNAFSEASPDAIVVVDVMDRAIYHNARFQRMWGLPEGALDNRLCSEILAGVLPQVQDPEGFARRMQELYADQHRTEFSEVKLVDGRTLERQSVGLHTEEGTYLGRAWFYRDVTERVRAAEALRAGEERLRLFIRHTPAAVAMFDTDMRYIIASHRWNLDYGLGEGDLTGLSHYQVFPEISQEWKEIHQRILAGETMRREEDPFPRADGSIDYVRWENVPWRRDDGSIGGIVMFTEVVTERRRAREALRQSQARLAAVLDNAVDGIITIDTSGNILSVNPAVEQIFGWSRQEMEGGPVTRIMMEPYASKHDGFLRRYLETGVPHIIGQGGREVPGQRKDGSMVPVELAVSEVRVGDMRLFTGILRDITERKQARERLMTANAELEARQMRLDEDLAAAGEIQKSLLPQQLPVLGGELEIDWLFEPSQRVGGDIFDIFPLGADKLAAYVLDVSGHGVPSALVTVSVSQALRPGAGVVTSSARDGLGKPVPPAQVVERLNRDFPMERFDKFFSMVYLVLDHRSGMVEYCNAGHPPPLLVRSSGSVERLEAGGMLVGMGDVANYIGGAVQLGPGDMLLLYTDGVTEYSDEHQELYGEERLEQVARRMAGWHPDEALDHLWGSLMRFGRGAEPEDDVSVVCIRRCSR
jgi:sigma-B regulation protein RsbU (phosphoserine phosphatase)